MACRTTVSMSACRAAAQSMSAGLSATAFCGNVGIGVSPLGAPRQGCHVVAPIHREDTPFLFSTTIGTPPTSAIGVEITEFRRAEGQKAGEIALRVAEAAQVELYQLTNQRRLFGWES